MEKNDDDGTIDEKYFQTHALNPTTDTRSDKEWEKDLLADGFKKDQIPGIIKLRKQSIAGKLKP
jgi:hypothetical protein